MSALISFLKLYNLLYQLCMCVYAYEIESRVKDARKVFEQPQAARWLTNATPNGEDKRKHFIARF